MTHDIFPSIWMKGNSSEAAHFYCAAFSDSSIIAQNPFVTTFKLAGQPFMALNGAPEFGIKAATSFFVWYETEEDTKNLWDLFLVGGEILMPIGSYPWSNQYGWLRDKFGVSWQIYTGKKQEHNPTICTSLQFAGINCGKAEAAITYYAQLFQPSKVEGILHYSQEEGFPTNWVKHAQFQLGSYTIMVMDSPDTHETAFSDFVSLVVTCDTQEEIDHYWNYLTKDGQPGRCGWLKDAFGHSWQIVPSILGKLMSDPEKSAVVVQNMMKMNKFIIADL